MGMLAYELQTVEREGSVEQSLLAKKVLQLLTYATILVTLPGFKTRTPRALPHHVQGMVDRLKRFACSRDDPDWTHSSLKGGKDPLTTSGKLKIPDDLQSQEELAATIVMCHAEDQPMTLVERTTQQHPYIEDLDIEVVLQSHTPRDYLLYTPNDNFQFLRFRAAILHKLFPQITELTLLLYTASGWHSQKQCYKTSFHCVWPQLVVDRERAHVVRLKTIDTFHKEAQVPGSWCERLTQQVAAASGKAEKPWETVFDITGKQPCTLLATAAQILDSSPRNPDSAQSNTVFLSMFVRFLVCKNIVSWGRLRCSGGNGGGYCARQGPAKYAQCKLTTRERILRIQQRK